MINILYSNFVEIIHTRRDFLRRIQYEVLEFVGDKVLDLAVIRLLVNEHCSMTMGWNYQQQLMYQSVWRT